MPRKPKRTQKQQASGRDDFQTPSYGTDLLVPLIPKRIKSVWECAAGKGKIADRLIYHGYDVLRTDIKYPDINIIFNFLNRKSDDISFGCIITNPPFSLKIKFYQMCRAYKRPFALLIPADYSSWIVKATQDGCEKIIPNRRIDYITPTGLSGASGHTSYYHSMWLTWGFNLGCTETFVDLPLEWKRTRI